MKSKVTEESNNIDEILKALSFFNEHEIEIGIFATDFKGSDGTLTTFGKAVVNEYGASIEVTDKMRAYLHHNGIHLKADTTEINIPERSFIRGSFDENRKQIYKTVDDMIADVLDGQLTADEMVGIVGENGVRMIREYIQAGISPGNASLTLENKKGTTPLIDTGDLLKSLDWRVVKR